MPRISKVTDGWSDEARQILADGALKGYTAVRVTQAILDATGEAVAERTVSRRMAELREAAEMRAAAKDRAVDLVEAMKAGNVTASEYVQALAMRALELEPDEFTGSDPVKVQRLAMKGEELRLKREAQALKARELAIDEAKLAMLQARESRALAALTEDGPETITPAMRLEKVREIMGLTAQVIA